MRNSELFVTGLVIVGVVALSFDILICFSLDFFLRLIALLLFFDVFLCFFLVRRGLLCDTIPSSAGC